MSREDDARLLLEWSKALQHRPITYGEFLIERERAITNSLLNPPQHTKTRNPARNPRIRKGGTKHRNGNGE